MEKKQESKELTDTQALLIVGGVLLVGGIIYDTINNLLNK